MEQVKHFDILGVKIAAVNLTEAIGYVDRLVREKSRNYICVAPVSTIVSCQEDARYKEVVNKAGMVTPDGMPTVWLGKLKGYMNMDRVYGPDLMVMVCQAGESRGYRHYFYGATADVCDLLEKKLKERFPLLNVAGKFSPPFRDLSQDEDKDIIETINRANPDILWVGLGSPKQDFWMHEHRDKLKVPVMIGVGAAFDFLSGQKKQAPRWIQRCGLEWLFRLCCEPRRLWRRYLVGNTKFLYLLLLDNFKKKNQDKVL